MSNPIVDVFKVKDLRQRILFTLFWLVVYRIGTFIALPGVNVTALQAALEKGGGGIADFLDFFAGGAFKNFSIFLLGVMPYISAQIIMQLALLVVPRLKKMAEEEGGRKRINRWTRIGCVVVCVIQGWVMVQMAHGIEGAISKNMSWMTFNIIGVLAVTCGTMFIIWMGDQITKKGIGNGISLMIFAGIVARLPQSFIELFQKIRAHELNLVVVFVVLAMFVLVVAMVVIEQQGQRKIPVNYAKRVVGRKMYGGQNTYIPFKINPSGVIPVIFASSLLTFPVQVLQGAAGTNKWLADALYWIRPNGIAFNVLYVLFIIFFAYFYTQVSLNPQEISKNIRENGGSIPGIRSEKIEEYLTKVLNRIVLPGSLYLALIALIPMIVQQFFNFPSSLAQLLGGTSLIIIVGVDLDTMAQVEANLRMHHHEGLVKKGRIKGRNL